MKKTYDIVFVTHIPSFYKVNLYNALSKYKKIAVIFLADASKIRKADFMGTAFEFDAFYLTTGPFETRNQLKTCWALIKKLATIRTQRILVGGWDCVEFWVLVFLQAKYKNGLVLESSIHESQTSGFVKFLKQRFLSRISVVYGSGKPHQALLQSLGYQGKIFLTQGVGLFALSPRSQQIRTQAKKFLYVGRLSEEKNVLLLVQAFAFAPELSLTIVGDGPMLSAMQKDAPANIQFIGHVPNHELHTVYAEHDAFILPSTKEPWGLVVEEAVYHGLPILVSNKVGCAHDLVENYSLGVLFDPHNVSSLVQGLNKLNRHFNHYAQNCAQFDFSERDKKQVEQYLQ